MLCVIEIHIFCFPIPLTWPLGFLLVVISGWHLLYYIIHHVESNNLSNGDPFIDPRWSPFKRTTDDPPVCTLLPPGAAAHKQQQVKVWSESLWWSVSPSWALFTALIIKRLCVPSDLHEMLKKNKKHILYWQIVLSWITGQLRHNYQLKITRLCCHNWFFCRTLEHSMNHTRECLQPVWHYKENNVHVCFLVNSFYLCSYKEYMRNEYYLCFLLYVQDHSGNQQLHLWITVTLTVQSVSQSDECGQSGLCALRRSGKEMSCFCF